MDMMLAELEREFRENWFGFEPSRYDLYLQQVDADLRTDLLIRLLCAEIEFKYQPPNIFSGQSPLHTVDEDDQRVQPSLRLFLLRFPQIRLRIDGLIQLSVLEYALRIRFESNAPSISSYLELCDQEQGQQRLNGLLQLTERKLMDSRSSETQPPAVVSSGDSTVPEQISDAKVQLEQLPCNLGCFLLIRHLGKGGMGNVYSAIDLRSTAHVAVKVMRRMDSWSIYRFVEEFSWLSQLDHPHLVKLYDAFSEGDVRYFSMEQVEGTTIRQWFQTFPQVDPGRWDVLRQVLAQAASAIRFLHECNVIHRDVKPSNLMITAACRAMLLDLGLAMRAGKRNDAMHEIDDSKIVGTIQYLPPEILSGEAPTFASDWYSFGVLIYETITNSYPPISIEPKNKDKALRYRLNPQTLSEKLDDLPEDLVALCKELMASEPALRPSANEIMHRLGADQVPAISFATDTCCLGRDQELAELTSRRVDNTSPGKLILLRGESGIGKTTFIRHWTNRLAKSEQPLLFNLNCHRQDHTPLRALNLLAQQLVTILPELPRSLWEDLTESEGGEIVYGFPQMQHVVKVTRRGKDPSVGAAEMAARRAAGLHALLYWLRKLSQRRAVVIVFDDVQWADADSGRLLSQLFSQSSGFEGTLIMIDQGESVPSPLVECMLCLVDQQTDQIVHEIRLKPLESNICEALLEKWSDTVSLKLSMPIKSDLTRRSGGNPFLLREVLCAYANHILQCQLTDEEWLHHVPNQLGGGHLRRRFSLLPVSMERVLQFFAIADQPLGFHQVQSVTRVLPNELLPLINYLASQGWIRINGNSLDSELEIAHDRFREIVLESMLPERTHRRHFRLARILLSETPPPWSRIAHHYWKAERFRESAACYMEAARSSARHNAFVEALWFLERAFHPDADRTEAERRVALRLQADCYAASGDSTAAIAAYQHLQTNISDPHEKAHIECLLGEQWIRAGKLKEGINGLHKVLTNLGVATLDRDTWLSNFRLRMEARQFALSSPAAIFGLNTKEPFSAAEQCLNRVASPLTFMDVSLGSRLIINLAKLAMHRGRDSDRALAIIRWSMLLSLGSRSMRYRAVRWLRAGRRLARTSCNLNAQALGRLVTCLWLMQQGRFVDSLKQGKQALSLYRDAELSHHWEAGFVQWSLLSHHWYVAHFKQLCESTEELRRQAKDRQDSMWSFWMHCNCAQLSDLVLDQPLAGRRSLELAKQSVDGLSFQSPKFFLWITELRQALYEGDPATAVEKLESQWPQLRASSMLRINYYAWIAYSLRWCCYLACAKQFPQQAGSWLQRAEGCLSHLRDLQEPNFLLITEAQALVTDAARGRVADQTHWSGLVNRLKAKKIDLFALAIAWHQSLHAAHSLNAAELGSTAEPPRAEQEFCDRGCVNPRKLMRLILPLP